MSLQTRQLWIGAFRSFEWYIFVIIQKNKRSYDITTLLREDLHVDVLLLNANLMLKYQPAIALLVSSAYLLYCKSQVYFL